MSIRVRARASEGEDAPLFFGEHASSSSSSLVVVDVEGTGFLRYMVRIIVGTLVEVGRGRLTPAEVGEILRAKNRAR